MYTLMWHGARIKSNHYILLDDHIHLRTEIKCSNILWEIEGGDRAAVLENIPKPKINISEAI